MIPEHFERQAPEIESILGYRFRERSILLGALTRRSFWHEHRDSCADHNERMEFLGDAVLGLVIADILYSELPEDEEGELQKRRAGLVNRAALALLARQLDLGRFIRMGRGDEISGCRERDSILADTVEAVVAAVYLDGGFPAAFRLISRHFYPLIKACSTRDGAEDYKSALQEVVQGVWGVTPTYDVIDQWGEEHDKTFVVGVFIGNDLAGQGTGRSKREAAQNAACEAMIRLERDPRFAELRSQSEESGR